MPIGAALMNGIVASVVIVLAPILPNQDLFCTFLLECRPILVIVYPSFPSFYKLRKLIPIHHVRLKLTENQDFKSFSGFTNDYDYYFTDFHSSTFRF